MNNILELPIQMTLQPTEETCGQTCLQAVYEFFGLSIPVEDLIDDIPVLDTGGTLGVTLARHALKSGFNAQIYTYNLQVFDPTWFKLPSNQMIEKLRLQSNHSAHRKTRIASKAYVDYLSAGGKIRFKELTPRLIKSLLRKGLPILTGLSATYLYQSMREIPETNAYNDLEGEVAGHFVVVYGYNAHTNEVLVSDPLKDNPFFNQARYPLKMYRLINAILLGILTYDANLLVIHK